MNNEEEKKKEKLTLRERLKDKRERAKIELMLYAVFFVGLIIFARILGSNSNYVEDTNNITEESFISTLEDNFEYYTIVTINDNTYEYYGKVLGNNSTINLKVDNQIKSYYLMNKKYYVQEEGNYILTEEEEVYPYINNRYLNIDNIKNYLELSTKDNDTYKVKLSDIVLDSNSSEYLTIYINEGDKNIVIDYTELFKLTDITIDKVLVNITYNNIGNLISLEE